MDVVSLFVQITTIKTLIFIDSHNQTTVVKSPMLSVFSLFLRLSAIPSLGHGGSFWRRRRDFLCPLSAARRGTAPPWFRHC